MQSLSFEVRTAQHADVPQMRDVWRASFGDTDEYLDLFFSRRFVPENALAAVSNGRVVSQLFLLPARLRAQNGLFSAYYLFAAATLPAYRGKGAMAQLLQTAQTLAAARGVDAIVLLPGTPELYRFYARFGYETAFCRRTRTFSRTELLSLAGERQRASDAVRFLSAYSARHDGLCWDVHALCYALDEHRLFRGGFAACENAFAAVSDDEAFCLCEPQHFAAAAALLADLTDLPQLSLTVPADLPFGERADGGMILRLEKDIQLRDAFICFAME